MAQQHSIKCPSTLGTEGGIHMPAEYGTVAIHVPRNRANMESPFHRRALWFPEPTGQMTFLRITVTCERNAKSESVSHSVVSNSATPGAVASQTPLSLGFSRQEYWSELLCPLQRIFPTQGSKLRLLQLLPCRRILNAEPLGKPLYLSISKS